MAFNVINVVMASNPLLWASYLSNQPPDTATWIYFRHKCSKLNSPFSSSPGPPKLSLLRTFLITKWHHLLLRSGTWKPSLTPHLFISHSQLLPKTGWILFQNVSPARLPNLYLCQPDPSLHRLSPTVKQLSSKVYFPSPIPAPPISSFTVASVVFIKLELVSHCSHT